MFSIVMTSNFVDDFVSLVLKMIAKKWNIPILSIGILYIYIIACLYAQCTQWGTCVGKSRA